MFLHAPLLPFLSMKEMELLAELLLSIWQNILATAERLSLPQLSLGMRGAGSGQNAAR